MPSDKQWRLANLEKKVLAACIRRAEEVAAKARGIAHENGASTTYTVTSGVRPGGRVFARVTSSSWVDEFGDEEKEIKGHRALRKAKAAVNRGR